MVFLPENNEKKNSLVYKGSHFLAKKKFSWDTAVFLNPFSGAAPFHGFRIIGVNQNNNLLVYRRKVKILPAPLDLFTAPKGLSGTPVKNHWDKE